jgi:3-oxoacyl-[acyl-carrier-protein] synthase III
LAEIKAISYFLPEETLTNKDLSKQFNDYSEDRLFKLSGIKKRHITKPYHIGSDLGHFSAKKFFKEYPHIKTEDIDVLLFCTEGLDYKAPTTACLIHERLGLKQSCCSIDVPSGCTGFMNGLLLAKSLVDSGQAKHVLLITSDVPSHVISDKDIEIRMIFGDGAATTLISQCNDTNKIGNFSYGTNGQGAEYLMVDRSGSRDPIDSNWLEHYSLEPGMLQHGKMLMNGAEVLRFSLRCVPKLLEDVLIKNNLKKDEIDLFIFHQASGFMLKALQKKCKIDSDKFYIFLEDVGNTVSSTIPIALYEAMKSGKAKKGNKVMLLGFGIGFSWGGTVIEI